VTISTPNSDYTIDRSGGCWSCSYFFSVSQRLPCQHMMFVADEVCGRRTLSRKTVAGRWNMSNAFKLADVVKETTKATNGIEMGPAEDNEDAAQRSTSKLQFVRVRLGVRSSLRLVLSCMEKRKIVRTELEGLTDFLARVGSTVFYERATQLQGVIRTLRQSWEPPSGQVDEQVEPQMQRRQMVAKKWRMVPVPVRYDSVAEWRRARCQMRLLMKMVVMKQMESPH
jgi:hypothetical protein